MYKEKIKNCRQNFYITTLAIALPSIIQQLVTNLSQMLDNVMVGSLKEEAIAGVAAANQVFFIFLIASFGITGAGGIFIAQFKGGHNYQKIKEIFRIILLFSFMLGLIFFLGLHFFGYEIIRLFVQEEETIILALDYLNYVKYTYLLFAVSTAFNSSYRFYGKVKLSMYAAFVSVFVNMFFNYSLINGNFGFPALGVAGSGIATLIARSVELIVFISLAIKLDTPLKTKLTQLFQFEKKLLINYVKRGYALLFNEFFWAFGIQVINILYAQRITQNVAALNIATTLTNMMFIGMGGMSVATSIIIGKQLGQSNYKQAKKDAKKIIKLAIGIGFSLGISSLIIGITVLEFTNLYQITTETEQLAYRFIMISSIFGSMYYLNATIFFTLRAGGDTKSVLIMDAGYVWLLVIPIMLLLNYLEVDIIIRYLLVQILEFIKLALAIYRYKKGKWLLNLTK